MMEQKNLAGKMLLSLILLSCLSFPLYASPSAPAKGLFLVASKDMTGSYFAQTVILLVSADESGAMGLVINRPTIHLLRDAVPSLKDAEAGKRRVFSGGPVMPRMYSMLFKSQQPPKRSRHVTEEIHYTNDQQAFLSQARTPSQMVKIFFGYTGWAPGQLEQEIERGGWHLVAADPGIVFQEETENIWQELIPGGGARWTELEMNRNRDALLASIINLIQKEN